MIVMMMIIISESNSRLALVLINHRAMSLSCLISNSSRSAQRLGKSGQKLAQACYVNHVNVRGRKSPELTHRLEMRATIVVVVGSRYVIII